MIDYVYPSESSLAGNGRCPLTRFKPISAVLAAAGFVLGLSAQSVMALPEGGRVSAGSATIQRPNAASVQVNQSSNKAVVDWQSFDIDRGETVRFRQPSARSVILNRIDGSEPSRIYGQLDANGKVFLVNPSGVYFAPGAKVNVGSLVASSLKLSNSDFLKGNYRFTDGGAAGKVDNEGRIRAKDGGYVALIGKQVSNKGEIIAPRGSVALGAGERVTIDLHGDGLLGLKVDAAAAKATISNSGVIEAAGGAVTLSVHAKNALVDTVLNVEGTVRATGLIKRGGSIYLDGGDSGVVRVSGALDASNREADLKIASAEPSPQNQTPAKSIAAAPPLGGARRGGRITVQGEKVGLFGKAKIDASGDQGGGTVLIGGDYQGKNPAIRNANRTYVGREATIKADAIKIGHGGKVIIWADEVTRQFGSISARGGSQGGDGGFVEISGKRFLDFRGQVDTRAPKGQKGNLLLDPDLITITHSENSNDDTNINGAGTADSPFSSNDGNQATLTDGTINRQLVTTDITVQTSSGDIFVDNTGVTIGPSLSGTAPFSVNNNKLTLNSAGSIRWNGDWSYSNEGQLTLYARGESAGGGFIGGDDFAGFFGGTLHLMPPGAPLLMVASNGIGSAGSPVLTTGLTDLAATTVNGGIFLSNSGSGNINISELTNPVTASEVIGLSTKTSGDIQVTNSVGGIAIAQPIATAVNGNIDLTASDGDLTVGSTITADGAGVARLTATGVSGNIDFSGAGTLRAGSAELTARGTVTSGTAATDIDTSANNGTISVNAGAIGTGPNPLEVKPGAGKMSFTANNGGIFVDQSEGNLLFSQLAEVSVAGGGQTIQFSTTDGGITVDNTAGFIGNTANQNLVLTARGGAITQGAAGALTGNTLTAKTLNDAGAAIALNGAANDFATVNLLARNAADSQNAAGAIAYRDATGFAVGAAGIATTSNVGLTAGGSITQNGALTVGGRATVRVTGANSDIVLGEANDLGSVSVGAARGGSLRDLTLRNVNAKAIVPSLPTSLRNLTLRFDNAGIVLPRMTLTGALSVTTGGNITQSGAITTGTAGNRFTTLTNDASIDLSKFSNALTGTVSLNTQGTSGDAAIKNGALRFAASNLGGDLTATATAGDITQSGALTVGKTATFTARSDRNINLGLNNDFGTVAIASGNDVTLRDINAIDLGASRVWGDLAVTAAGSITQSGALTMANSAGGTAKFIVTAVDSDMLLGQANFFGSVSVGAGGVGSVRDLTLRNVNSRAIIPSLPTVLRNLSLQFDGTGMVLPGITVTGDFNATAGRGSITQLDPNSPGGALSVAGDAVFDSAGSEVTLANRNNHFGGTVSVPDDLGTQRNVTLTADRINVGRQGITGKQIVLTADEITSLDDSSLVQVTEPDFTQVGLSLHGLKGDGVFGTFDRPLFVFMDSELQLTPNTPSLTNIVLLAGPPEPKPRYLNGPGRRVVDYNFGLTAPPAGVAALNAAYAPLRRLLSEVLASGYSKENVRKQLAEGLVLETGVAPPALDNIVDEGIRLPEVSCGGIRTASWATSLEC